MYHDHNNNDKLKKKKLSKVNEALNSHIFLPSPVNNWVHGYVLPGLLPALFPQLASFVLPQVNRDVLELVVDESLGGNAADAVFTFNLTVTSSSSNETNLANNIAMQRLDVTGQADLSVTM